jgi:DNA-binding PadR family transcriptional regulator
MKPPPLHPREFLILLALLDEPQHGYGVLKRVEAASGGEVRMDPANLYRVLRRLHRDGLVAEVRASSDDRRRMYKLTPAGREVAAAEGRRVVRLAEEVRALKLVPASGKRR